VSRDVITFLDDILTAIDDIIAFTAAFDLEAFKQDRKTIYAVTRALEIMGEATKNIPAEVRQAYPQIPWKQISGMRDKLIHSYFSVNIVTLWKAARQDAPQLRQIILAVKKDLDRPTKQNDD
jgi:uncharacterized protein with HEPN domain